MATKSARKEFEIERRFTVWVTTQISAADFDAAVEAAKKMQLSDYLREVDGDTEILDWESQRGLAVRESWS